MLEFLDMGKHSVFVYLSYLIAIILMIIAIAKPHVEHKILVHKIKNDTNRKE